MKKLTALTFFAACLLYGSSTSPDAHIVTPLFGKFMFVMNEMLPNKMPSGYCCRIDDDKTMHVCWKIKGFYAYPGELQLSADGIFLFHAVRLTDASLANIKLGPDTVFLNIYKNGKEIRSFTLKEVFDPSDTDYQVFSEPNVSIYEKTFIESAHGHDYLEVSDLCKKHKIALPNEKHLFISIKTAEGIMHLFDMDSGAEIYREKTDTQLYLEDTLKRGQKK